MKTLLFIVVSLFSGITLFAQEPKKENSVTSVEINRKEYQNPPRGLLIVPIECYLNNRTLHFSFYENLGNTTIIVRGANNNEVRNVDSTDSFLEINMFNFNNGIYSIEIIAENGDVYIGEFQL